MEAYLRDTPAATLDRPARLKLPLGMWHSIDQTASPFTDDVVGAIEAVVLDPGLLLQRRPQVWKGFPAEKLRALLDK